MTELAARLRAMRAELVERMASELAADRDIHSWLPLLAQIQTSIQAIEALQAIEAEEPFSLGGRPQDGDTAVSGTQVPVSV